jgi:hypothetical protein
MSCIRWLFVIGSGLLAFCCHSLSAAPAGSTVVRTNFVERWVTNAIEVRIPVNRIVNECHTNFLQRVTTNVVEAYVTNILTRTVTNQIPVTITRTNLVQNYQTNYKTLNLTNWTTVLVLKTNWVTRAVTNVVEVEMQSGRVEQAGAAPAPRGESTARDVETPGLEPLVIEAQRGSRPGGSGQIPVEMRARWRYPAGTAAEVLQWRVEGESGAFLCFGQEPQFSRALPAGRYKVQVKTRAADSNATLTFKATLLVGANEVRIEPGALAKR